jgi:sugar lactone lactonase YvrE
VIKRLKMKISCPPIALAVLSYVAVAPGCKKSSSPPPVRKVTTFAGSGQASTLDGNGEKASFYYPTAIAIDKHDNLFVVGLDELVRKISPSGVVTTVAGSGYVGSADGPGATATFNNPIGIAVDDAGNLYIAENSNNKIRKVDPSGMVSTIAGNQDNSEGFADGLGSSAGFRYPFGIVCDRNGNLIVSDAGNNKVRKISPAGQVITIAGSTQNEPGSIDGPDTSARFYAPCGIALDQSGNIYITDATNNKIRKVSVHGYVSTIAGQEAAGYVDGAAAAAQFDQPFGVAADKQGNLFVSDYRNHVIRQVSADGHVSTLAGTGRMGFLDGSLDTARFDYPFGLALDSKGNLYVADEFNNRIRKIFLH